LRKNAEQEEIMQNQMQKEVENKEKLIKEKQ